MSACDHFETLGLARKYHVSLQDLEARYHAAAREHHPDRNRGASASALATAELTAAYRALRDPMKRAEYILFLEGVSPSDYTVSQLFLMEILELREQLADAKAVADGATIERLRSAVGVRHDGAMAEVFNLFREYDAGDRTVLRPIADHLIAMRYFDRFLEEVEAYNEEHGALP
jgi:Fe-S protein assembly co-chaperone HscB